MQALRTAFKLAGKPCCYSQGYFHYWPHLSVRSLISTSIFYSVAVMAACLRDRTTKRGRRNEVRGCSALCHSRIQRMKLKFLLCHSPIRTDMFSWAWECILSTWLVLTCSLPSAHLVLYLMFRPIFMCTLGSWVAAYATFHSTTRPGQSANKAWRVQDRSWGRWISIHVFFAPSLHDDWSELGLWSNAGN